MRDFGILQLVCYIAVYIVPVSLSETTVQITLGIIANNEDSSQRRDFDLGCCQPVKVTIQLHYANYSEIFQVFKKVRYLDQAQDIDLIVLTDYTRVPFMPTQTLKPKNKDMIVLNKGHGINKDDFKQLMRDYTNTSVDWNRVSRFDNDDPYCKTDRNLTESERAGIAETILSAPPSILANLVRSQKWKSIFIFYESNTAEETRLFLDELPFHHTVFAKYNMDTVNDVHKTLLGIYNTAVKVAQKIYFVVFCKIECILRLFKEANLFDYRNKKSPTLLNMFSRWIVVVHDFNYLLSYLLQEVAGNLHNVAIAAIPEMMSPTPKMIEDSLEKLFASEQNYTLEDKMSEKKHVIDRISTEIISLEPGYSCSHYAIDTLYWTKQGREFHTVGYADLQGHVVTTSDIFPNLKYGYSQRRFLVTTAPYEPYVIKREVNGTVEFVGIYMELLHELARVLNFTYTLIEPPDGKWGGVDTMVNGTPIFNGMVGQLQRHECDFAAAPLTIIPARDIVVDFTYPASHEYSTVVVRKPDPNARKWRTLLNPFKPEILLYIGAALLVATVLVFLIEKYGAYYQHPDHVRVRAELGGLNNLHDSFWYMYGALLCQGGVHLPDSMSGRTFVGLWWIFCIIIVGTYGGNLIAFLTVSKFVAPFNTLEEMLELSGTYKWGTQGGTFWETVFTTSNAPVFRGIGDAMIEFNETDKDIFNPNLQFHLERVKSGGYAWIADITSIEFAMSKECSLSAIKEKFLPMTDAFAFQHNSPHTAIFSEQIMKSHEAGLLEIWRRKWWPKLNFCNDGVRPESKPISLLDVQSAFYVCLVGFFVGTVAFIAELIVFKIRNRTPRNSDQTQSGVSDPAM